MASNFSRMTSVTCQGRKWLVPEYGLGKYAQRLMDQGMSFSEAMAEAGAYWAFQAMMEKEKDDGEA